MDHARIAALLAPFLDDANDQRLTADDLERISTYIDILLRWNARINLTAIRDPEQIVTRHFGESFFAARILFPTRSHVGTTALDCSAERSPVETQPGTDCGPARSVADVNTISVLAPSRGRAALQGRVADKKAIGAFAPEVSHSSILNKMTLADVGSGPGFPGIPIKLWHPDIALTLIESNQKKATFLREVARALTLTDINILSARAESLRPTAFDVVTLRAVERFESILPVAARLVAPGGHLALLISSAQRQAAESQLAKVPDFHPRWLATLPIPLSRSRILALASRSGESERQGCAQEPSHL